MKIKKIILFALPIFILTLFAPKTIFAQTEKIEKTELYSYEIEDFVKGKDIASKLITSSGVDYSESYKVGWEKTNEVFGLEGMGLSFLNDVLEVGAVNKVSDACGDIGMGLAFIQLGIDIYSGNTGQAALNFSKSSTFYAIGKIGSQGLKIASIGVSFIDYALNKFGTTAVAARVGVWNSAFRNYNNRGPGKRNLTEWKNIFTKLDSQEAIESAIRSHLKKFWNESDGLSYATVKTAALGIGDKWAADPLESEKEAIENSYMAELLLPYLKPLFYTMAREAKDAQIKSVQKSYKNIVATLNASHKVDVTLVGSKEAVTGVTVKLGDGFMEAVTDASGKAVFNFTVYGMLKHGLKSPAKVAITIKTKDGEKELVQEINSKKPSAAVKFNVGGVSDVSGVVTDAKEKKPVEGVKISITGQKKNASTSASGEYLIKDIPDGSYKIAAEKKGFQKKEINFELKAQSEPGGVNPVLTINIELASIEPRVEIKFPKNGQVIEDLQPTIAGIVEGGANSIEKSAITFKFDGKSVDFNYDERSGIVSYSPPTELKEDPITKCKHNVELTALIGEEPKKTLLSASCAFTAGIRPQIIQLEFNEKYPKDKEKEPLFIGQAYDKHSGPDPATLLASLDGATLKTEYSTINENNLTFYYFPKGAKLRGGSHTVKVTINDKAGIQSMPGRLLFELPGPNIQLVKPVDVGKVISGDAFVLLPTVKNIGTGASSNLMGRLYCNDRNYASIVQATTSYGAIEPGAEANGTPFFNVKTAQNLGNPQNGEPVYCNFTLRLYEYSDPQQYWEEKFSVPIYPGEMTGGTVFVKLLHGTYMEGTWPVHTAYQTVCLTGDNGTFTTTSDANGNATFENIPPGEYTTYVSKWYTYGAKLGEYVKSVTVEAGGRTSATLKGSCPYLFVWNGKEYEKDNDIYSVANAMTNTDSPFAFNKATMEKFGYTDYYRIEKNLVAKDGLYLMMLKEVRNEVSHTDAVSLLVVDHPKGTKILCDINGNIFTYTDPQNSDSAITDGAANIKELISVRDGKGWDAYNNDKLDMEFKVNSSNAKIIVFWKGFVDGSGKEANASDLGRPSIKVYVNDKNNQWVQAGKIYPREEWSHSIVDLSGYIKDQKNIRVRFVATSCHKDKYSIVDLVGLDTTKNGKIFTSKLKLAKAMYSFAGNVTEKMLTEDNECVEMAPEGYIQLSFLAQPAKQNSERSFIFVSRGYYNSLSEGSFAVHLAPKK